MLWFWILILSILCHILNLGEIKGGSLLYGKKFVCVYY